jgi:hypothetical protein
MSRLSLSAVDAAAADGSAFSWQLLTVAVLGWSRLRDVVFEPDVLEDDVAAFA